MTEKFSIDLLSKSHEKYENLKVVPITLDIDGKEVETELSVYKIFSPVKIQECVNEFIINIDKVRRRKNSRYDFGNVVEPYLMWLMIKYFTELEESMPTKFEEQINSINQMINTGALFQIMIHFDEEQIELVKEHIEIALETFDKNKDVLDKMKMEYAKKIVDKSLLD